MFSHTINSGKVFLGFIMKFLGFLLEFVEAPFSIGIDSIFGVFTNLELDLELLWRAYNTLLKAFETHIGSSGTGEQEGEDESRGVKEEGNCQGGAGALGFSQPNFFNYDIRLPRCGCTLNSSYMAYDLWRSISQAPAFESILIPSRVSHL